MSEVDKLYTEEDLNPRYAPPGQYRGFVAAYEMKTSQQGTPFATLFFKIGEPLSGQDMTGVELNRHVQSRRFYISEKAAPRFLKMIAETVDLDFPITVPKALEQLQGAECIFEYAPEVNSQTGKTYTNVTAFRKP